MVVGEQQRKIEECAAKVGLDVHGAPKVVFSLVDVLVVHCEHAEIEVDALVLIWDEE